jgi:hypothetical protein
MSVYESISPMNPYTAQDQLASQNQMNAINAAGPDFFDKALTDVRESRRSLLESIAAAGSAGRAEYQRQAEQAELQRSTHVNAALAEAQQRGNLTPAWSSAIEGTINQPYTQATSARDANNANWQNLFNAMGTANDAYFRRYEGSLPIIQQGFKNELASNFAITRSEAQRDIERGKMTTGVQLAQLDLDAAIRAREGRWRDEDIAREERIRLDENKREDADQATELLWRQKEFDEDVRRYGLDYALEQERLKIARANAASSGSGSGSAGYFGTGMNKTELTDALPGMIATTKSTYAGPFGAGLVGGATMGAKISPDQYAADLLERVNGITPGVLRGLLPKSDYTSPTAKFNPLERKVYDDTLTGASRGRPFSEAMQRAISAYGDTESVRNAVIAAEPEYQRLLGQYRQSLPWPFGRG